MIRILVVAVIFTGLYAAAYAQNIQKIAPKPFQYIRSIKGAEGVRNKIEFWDSLTNTVSKTLYLKELNPFTAVKGEQRGVLPGYETPVYTLFSNDTDSTSGSRNHPDHKTQPDKALIRYRSTNNDRNFIAVVFCEYIVEDNHNVVDAQSHIMVFDKKGTLVSEMAGIHSDGYAPVITSDGKYVLLNTGEDWGEGAVSSAQGIMICDLKSKKILYQNTKGRFTGTDIMEGTLFLTTNDFTKEHIEYQIFNCDLNRVFSKTFSLEESANIVKIGKGGMQVKDGQTGKVRFLRYDRDFVVDKMKGK